MQDEASSTGRAPRGVLLAAAGLIAFTILAAAVGRWTGVGVAEVATTVPVEAVELRFQDRPDGAVAVYEALDGRTVAVLAPGTNGFVRGVLRGLARERRQHEVGDEPPFRLVRWQGGGLALEDPSTGRRIELEAFGQTNADAFARLLERGSDAS